MSEGSPCSSCVVLDRASYKESNPYNDADLAALSLGCPLVKLLLKRASDTGGKYLVRCTNDPSQTVVAGKLNEGLWSLSHERDDESYLRNSRQIFTILRVVAENAINDKDTQRNLGGRLVNDEDKSKISAVTRRVITRFSDLLEQDLVLMVGKPEVDTIDRQVEEEGYRKGFRKYNEVRKRYIAEKWIEANSSPNPELMFDDRWYFALENEVKNDLEEWKGDSLERVFKDKDYRMKGLTVEEINYLLIYDNEFSDIGTGMFYEQPDTRTLNELALFMMDELYHDPNSVNMFFLEESDELTEDSVRELFENCKNILIIRNFEGDIVGFRDFIREGSFCEISGYLNKSYRGKGIGAKGLRVIYNQIQKMGGGIARIRTLKSNIAAQRSFRKAALQIGRHVYESLDQEDGAICLEINL